MADLFDDIDDEAEDSEEGDAEDSEESEDSEEGEALGDVPVEEARVEKQVRQGVFADRDSVFDKAKRVDHRNPVVTRAEETANELLPARLPVATKAQLVAIFDSQGRPFVAYHQNGRALEKFRPPTKQEFEILRLRGQIVRGGLGEAAGAASAPVPAVLPAATPPPPPPAPKSNTWLYVGAAAAGVGALAWWYMKKQKDVRANKPGNDEDED